MMSKRKSPTTNALKDAGEYLDEAGIQTDAATVIRAVTRAVQEDRDVRKVLNEEVSADE